MYKHQYSLRILKLIFHSRHHESTQQMFTYPLLCLGVSHLLIFFNKIGQIIITDEAKDLFDCIHTTISIKLADKLTIKLPLLACLDQLLLSVDAVLLARLCSSPISGYV